MRYAQIRPLDVANGEGIRVSFFVTGCRFNCPGCFNKAYQDFTYGQVWTDAQTQEVIDALKAPYIQGLSVLGGEPFQNTEDLLPVLKNIRSSMREEQNIWIYSGYTFEELMEDDLKKEMLSLCDVLVDGLFVLALKDLRLKFRGSSNQRIIDLKKTFEKEEACILSL